MNWYSCAMLPWKKIVLIFLHQKWLGHAVMGKYHSELLMLFNLAFLMKCKYIDTFSKYKLKSLKMIWFTMLTLNQQWEKNIWVRGGGIVGGLRVTVRWSRGEWVVGDLPFAACRQQLQWGGRHNYNSSSWCHSDFWRVPLGSINTNRWKISVKSCDTPSLSFKNQSNKNIFYLHFQSTSCITEMKILRILISLKS